MFELTRQERWVLVVFGGIVMFGSLAEFAFKRMPVAARALEFLEEVGGIEPVDINKATARELLRVPRVGPVMAQRIIAYRCSNGPFATLEELKQVTGIGEKIYAAMADFIKLSGGEVR